MAHHQGALLGVQDVKGAGERGKDPAPVDVAHEQHLGPGVPGHGHVHDVLALEVDLGG